MRKLGDKVIVIDGTTGPVERTSVRTGRTLYRIQDRWYDAEEVRSA